MQERVDEIETLLISAVPDYLTIFGDDLEDEQADLLEDMKQVPLPETLVADAEGILCSY